MALGYRGASNRNGPSPIVYDLVPEAVLTGTDPGLGFGFFDNFIRAASHATTGTTIPGWIVTHVANTGTVIAGVAEGGGVMLAPAGAEDDGVEMQTSEAYFVDADTRIVFGARITLEDAAASDTYVGLSIHDTDVAGSIPDDNVGFSIVDGGGSIFQNIELSGSATNTDLGVDAASGTAIKLECYIDKENASHWYIDGVEYLRGTAATYLAQDQQLAMTIAQQAGATATDYLLLSWAYAWQWYV